MITVQQEEEVRSLIPHMTDWQIWDKTGIHRDAIAPIRKIISLCNELSKKQIGNIQKLLLLRVPVSAIELKTRIHKDKIMAVRRYYYLQTRRIQDGCKCPTCGRTDLECMKQIMEEINGKKNAQD